ncbi:MAG: chemotaxis response regulator protein-glutamate methylesterase [Alphaproteobacteria bacterium]|nr:chemotaxis response regulator protein-glutamate methylesterase [Alphaproteobacteria bacterium]
MLCDDSAVVRGLLARLLESDPTIEVVATAADGQAAIRALQRTPVDVLVLDIEMPVMDGLTALPKLLAVDADLKVIVASTLTKRNAQVSLQALASGAAEYIPKPTSSSELSGSTEFKRQLLEKVRELGAARRSRAARPGASPRSAPVPSIPVAATRPAVAVALRRPSTRQPHILAIGSSTGGPQALVTMLSALPRSFTAPIVVTQHMPATFTAILAEHLGRATNRVAQEGIDGESLNPGRIYVAPGGQHMIVEKRSAETVIRLTQEPPENFCRPAVDPMFRSVAGVFGPSTLAVVLTGMGSDGARGGKVIADAGGTVIAQDEATSVVWGMPGATAQAGACCAVLPLADIAPMVARLFTGVGS